MFDFFSSPGTEDLDQRLFIGAATFHGLVQFLGAKVGSWHHQTDNNRFEMAAQFTLQILHEILIKTVIIKIGISIRGVSSRRFQILKISKFWKVQDVLGELSLISNVNIVEIIIISVSGPIEGRSKFNGGDYTRLPSSS